MEDHDRNEPTTTDAGIPIESDEHSLTIGPDGPILLHDHYLIEQLAQFNRERVPERRPHAKGSGAFGRFEVTHDVSAFTKAAVFQPGTTTETVIRFFTVAGERSPDTWRDPRSFAAPPCCSRPLFAIDRRHHRDRPIEGIIVIGRFKGFARFWYDFFIGDDWTVAVVMLLALTVPWRPAPAIRAARATYPCADNAATMRPTTCGLTSIPRCPTPPTVTVSTLM
jgi:catalase